MKKLVENNKVIVGRRFRSNDLTTSCFSGAYPYMSDGALMRSTKETPIYCYSTNVQVDGEVVGATIWTTNPNGDEAVSRMESEATRIQSTTPRL